MIQSILLATAILAADQYRIIELVVTAEQYRWQNSYLDIRIHKGDEGIVLLVPITPKALGCELPEDLGVDIEIIGSAKQCWRIRAATMVDFTTLKRTLTTEGGGAAAFMDHDESPTARDIGLGSLQEDGKYKLRVLLHRVDRGTGSSAAELVKKDPSEYIQAVTYVAGA